MNSGGADAIRTDNLADVEHSAREFISQANVGTPSQDSEIADTAVQFLSAAASKISIRSPEISYPIPGMARHRLPASLGEVDDQFLYIYPPVLHQQLASPQWSRSDLGLALKTQGLLNAATRTDHSVMRTLRGESRSVWEIPLTHFIEASLIHSAVTPR